MTKLILTGSPISTNGLYRKRGAGYGMYMTDDGKARKEQYTWEARSQWKGKPLEDDVSVIVNLYFGTKAKHDIDNFTKILFDSLTGVCWKDDSQINRMTINKRYDKEQPRIEITIV